MPKYDAFGREIGEDTLAGLGGSDYAPAGESDGWTEAQLAEAAAAEAAPAAEPAPTPAGDDAHGEAKSSRVETPASGAAPAFDASPASGAASAFDASPAFGAPPRTIRMRRRGGAGCLVALIVFTVIAAAPIIAVVSLVGGARDAIDEVTDAIDSVPDDVVPDIAEPDPAPPTGIRGDSLVARGNFAAALDRIGGMGGATMIRLAPERLDAQLVRGSRQRGAQVTFDGEVTRGPASRSGGALEAIPLARIDPAAPARLVRGSAARFRVRPAGINYLVLMPWPGEGHRWIAYFKNGVYVQGDGRGRVVRRIS